MTPVVELFFNVTPPPPTIIIITIQIFGRLSASMSTEERCLKSKKLRNLITVVTERPFDVILKLMANVRKEKFRIFFKYKLPVTRRETLSIDK